MPLFEEDPALLSKSRLKSDLVAHNVPLPPARSKKEVLVELHVKHIDQKHAADFSSDEEDQVQDLADKEEALEDAEEAAEILDPGSLTDDELKAALLEHGVKAGPIVASTRALYERKLRTLLQSDGQNHLNGSEKGVLYSDSEEEEEEMEEDSERAKEETLEQSDQQESSQDPVKDTFKDLFPDTVVTPTGIYATRRKPIKGAAGRPVQYAYPDTPTSPTTQERREVERRLMPLHVRVLVFLIVVVVLYLVYICVEDNSFSPFSLEMQDTPVASGQE